MRDHDKSIKKPWQFKYYPRIVLFGRARLLNALSTTPNLNWGYQPALYGDGKGWLRWLSKVGPKGANPLRVSTETVIEIRQLYSGRIASNPFIASNRMYIVFPLRDHCIILFTLIISTNFNRKTCPSQRKY